MISKSLLWAAVALHLFLVWLPGAGHAQDGAQTFAKGLLVYRETQVQDDKFAPAVLYTDVEHFPASVVVRTSPTKTASLFRTDVAAIVPFDDVFSRDLIADDDVSFLNAKQEELEAAAVRFPKSQLVLKPVLALIAGYTTRLKQGDVRHRGTWLARTAYAAQMKAREDEAQRKKAEREMAEARRLAANEEERQQAAMKKARLEAEEAEEQRKAEAEKARLLANASLPLKAWSARILRDEIAEFAAIAGDSGAIMPRTLPAGRPDWRKNTLPLPVVAWKPRDRLGEMAVSLAPFLQHESPVTSPAVLHLVRGDRVVSSRAMVFLRMEKGAVINLEDLRKFRMLANALGEPVGGWLPSGIVSARTRLEFLKNQGGGAVSATITGEVSGCTCELVLSRPAVREDGLAYARLSLSVFY